MFYANQDKNIGGNLSRKEVVKQEEKLEYKDLLIAHDVAGFRSFAKKYNIPEILTFSDEDLSECMYVLKCTMPYLGEAFYEARNFFRRRQLEASLLTATSEEKEAFKGDYPLCAFCEYFRNPPPGEKVGCMHIRHEGSIPSDIACIAWTPIIDEKQV